MELIERLHNLPYELFEMIRRMTYQLQPKILLNDIKNYHETKKIIDNYYYNKFEYQLEGYPKADRNWLANDICCYLNNNVAMMLSIEDKYINTLRRFIGNNSKSNQDLSNMIKWYSNLDSNSEINMYWGLMTPEERDEMVSYYTTI
tara:strand:+ start:175 stop:612 length:438 start_codon:yes stop_codon:yes gene_type:complete